MNKHTTWDPGGYVVFHETDEEGPLVFDRSEWFDFICEQEEQ